MVKFIVRLKKKDEKEVKVSDVSKLNEILPKTESKIKIVEDMVVGKIMKEKDDVKIEEKMIPKDGIKPSDSQKNIFMFIKNQVLMMINHGIPQNLMIEAGAGCAKTTTLVMSLEYTEKLNVLFCAFNKDIVETLKTKVPKNVWVKTFHQAGYGAIRYRFKNVRFDDKKMYSIYRNLCENWNESKEVKDRMINPFIKLCGLIKNTLSEPTNENLMNLAEKYSVELDDSDELNNVLFTMVRAGMLASNSNPYTVDFNDMIYLPVKLNLNFYRSDVVFVDETQDLNNCQLSMLKMMIKDRGMIVCVGDRNQSIYGFRGADVNAIPRMIGELKTKVLPLMVTYRCGKNIVKLAKELVPALEAYSGNEDGKVENIGYDKFYELVREGDMTLCRNNAPLIKPVFHLLSKGIKVNIKGRDIGDGLIRLVKGLKVSTIEQFYESLDKWKDKEDVKAQRKKSESMMQIVEDKYNCLQAIAENCEDVNQIISRIEKIFDDSKSEITFSSIHRAKGLEPKKGNSVYIFEPQLIPSKYAKKFEDIQQEKNILYVAITRARNQLYFVGGNVNTKF